MKKILSLLALAIGCIVIVSCSDSDYTEKENSVKIVNANTVIDYKGGATSIEVTGSGISAFSSADWLTVTVNGNVITATAEYNDSQESRSAHITVTASNGDQTLVGIQQTGWTFDIELFKLTINDDEESYEIAASSAYDIEVSSESDWFSAEYDEATGKIKVDATANETGVPRSGTIQVKSGGITKEIPVYQAEFEKDVLGDYYFGVATSTAGTTYNWLQATLSSKNLTVKGVVSSTTVNVKIPISISTEPPYVIKIGNEAEVGTFSNYFLYLAYDNYRYDFYSRYTSYFFNYMSASSIMGELKVETDEEGNSTLACEFNGVMDLDGSEYGAISTWYILAMSDESYSQANNLGYLFRWYWPVLEKATDE